MTRRKKKRFWAMLAAGVMLCCSLPVNGIVMQVKASDEVRLDIKKTDVIDYTDDLKLLTYGDLDAFRTWNYELGYLDEKQKEEIKKYVETNIIKGVTDDYEKAHRIYDWIYTNVTYADFSMIPWLDPYDVFVNKVAVCGGFSNLYKAMLNSIGIPSVLISGNTPYGAHIWNAVYADDKWFYSDATWGGKYFDQGIEGFLQDHMPVRVEAVSIEAENGVLLGYDNGIAVVGVTGGRTSVDVPDMYKDLYVTSVSYKLFNSMYKIKELNLGAYIRVVDTQAVCNTLESISVSDKNTTFAAKDGVLFTKDFSRILIYPVQKKSDTFTLQKNTELFDVKDTFSNQYLENLEVEEGNAVYTSYDGALYNLDKTELIVVPAGKTKIHILPNASIDMMAFANVDTGKLTIYGEKGSPAHKYALEYGITFINTSDIPTPTPTVVPEPTKIPEPTAAPEPTKVPTPTVTPEPTKVPEPTVTPERFLFDDVQDKDQFYYEPVYWAYDNEITKGITPELFKPDDNCTRGQIITFIWRAKGEPKAETTQTTFTDVSEEFYYEAMLWGEEKGVINGYNDATFAPNDACTRAQIVTMLWRAQGKPIAANKEHAFTDVSEEFYYEAMLWAVENKITTGKSADRFAPNNIVLRSETVTFLYRVYGNDAER